MRIRIPLIRPNLHTEKQAPTSLKPWCRRISDENKAHEGLFIHCYNRDGCHSSDQIDIPTVIREVDMCSGDVESPPSPFHNHNPEV
ncbi:hypothetical protein Hdeb2414_s0010g00347351 [Helianthus debilis subsp. tardiflorus]